LLGSIAGTRAHFWPQTPLGWWAVRLLLAAVGLFIISVISVTVGGLEGPGFNPWIALTIIPAGIAALAGGLAGATALLRSHERAVAVVVPVAVGVIVLFFLVGELAVPH
jgi:hypothetical protein